MNPIAIKVLVRKLVKACWEGGDIEGFELQEMLVEAGALIEVIADRPCREDCNCEDIGCVFPTTCYRLAEAFK